MARRIQKVTAAGRRVKKPARRYLRNMDPSRSARGFLECLVMGSS
jgi:hypothetical protein